MRPLIVAWLLRLPPGAAGSPAARMAAPLLPSLASQLPRRACALHAAPGPRFTPPSCVAGTPQTIQPRSQRSLSPLASFPSLLQTLPAATINNHGSGAPPGGCPGLPAGAGGLRPCSSNQQRCQRDVGAGGVQQQPKLPRAVRRRGPAARGRRRCAGRQQVQRHAVR